MNIKNLSLKQLRKRRDRAKAQAYKSLLKAEKLVKEMQRDLDIQKGKLIFYRRQF